MTDETMVPSPEPAENTIKSEPVIQKEDKEKAPKPEEPNPIVAKHKTALSDNKKALEKLLAPYGGRIDRVQFTLGCISQAAKISKNAAAHYVAAANELGPGLKEPVMALGERAVEIAKEAMRFNTSVVKDMQAIELLADSIMRSERILKNQASKKT